MHEVQRNQLEGTARKLHVFGDCFYGINKLLRYLQVVFVIAIIEL